MGRTPVARANPAVRQEVAAVPQELEAVRQEQTPPEVRQGRAIAVVRQAQVPAAVPREEAAARQERVSPRCEWRRSPLPGRPSPSPHTACER